VRLCCSRSGRLAVATTQENGSPHLVGGDRSEETRVAYVALTRPQRYVAVAVPIGTPSQLIDAYINAGMTLAEPDAAGVSVE
jgi:hypothetical protein